jgi:hypothetical protein
LVHIPSGQFHAWAPFGPHLKPASSLQWPEHPSLGFVFPSSHSSVPVV